MQKLAQTKQSNATHPLEVWMACATMIQGKLWPTPNLIYGPCNSGEGFFLLFLQTNLQRRINVIYACGGGPDATFGKCMGHIEFFNSGMPAGMYGGGGWVREGMLCKQPTNTVYEETCTQRSI